MQSFTPQPRWAIPFVVTLLGTAASARAFAAPPQGYIPPQPARNVETTLFGGYSGGERVQGVSMLADGNILVAGSTVADFLDPNLGGVFPDPLPPFYDTSHNGASDAFVAVLTPDMSTVLYWTYLGGSAGDRAYFAMEDPDPSRNDIFVVGFTTSAFASFPITHNYTVPCSTGCSCYSAQNGCDGCFDVFVAKLSFNLKTLHYSTVIGGSGSENPRGSMTVDSFGRVYVSGRTNSTDFPSSNGPQGATCGPNPVLDAFLLRLSAAGSLDWSIYFGGDDNDNANANVRLDESEPDNPKVYIAGCTASADLYTRYQPQLPPTFVPYQNTLLGPTDGFVAKFDGNFGGILALTYLGGSAIGGGSGIDWVAFNDCLELDPRGRPVVTGITRSTDFPTTPNAWNQTHSPLNTPDDESNNDLFVAILTADLTGLVYGSYVNSLGGATSADQREEPAGLAVDPLGNVYVSGETSSPGFPVTGNALDTTITTSGERDCFLVKLFPGISTPSMLLYSSFFGGDTNVGPSVPAIELGNRGRSLQFVTIQSSIYYNKLLFCGSTTMSDFPTTPGVVFEDWLFGPPDDDEQQGFVSVHDTN